MGELFGLEIPCAPVDFAQMAALPVPSCDLAALRRILLERFRIEVAVTAAPSRQFVRASFQAYNQPSDADALVEALCSLQADPAGPFAR